MEHTLLVRQFTMNCMGAVGRRRVERETTVSKTQSQYSKSSKSNRINRQINK